LALAALALVVFGAYDSHPRLPSQIETDINVLEDDKSDMFGVFCYPPLDLTTKGYGER